MSTTVTTTANVSTRAKIAASLAVASAAIHDVGQLVDTAIGEKLVTGLNVQAARHHAVELRVHLSALTEVTRGTV